MLDFNRWKRSITFLEGPTRECANPYDQDATEHVRTARITGPWHRNMPAYLEKHAAKGLAFSFKDGFRCTSYDFFAELRFIEAFNVPTYNPDFDFGDMPISLLSGLRRIKASGNVKQTIDLSTLPHLQSCTMKWQKATESVFEAKCLKRLQIRSLSKQGAEGLANLTSLENLEVSHSGIHSFAPISALTQLRRLSLSVCRGLENLDGIEALQNLRCLHLDEVHHVSSFDCLTPLKNLEVLTIADARDIESVAPLKELPNLRALWIAGTKTRIVDGDLTPLTHLPKLAMLTLGNKRHYSHQVIKKWSWDNLEKPDTLLEKV